MTTETIATLLADDCGRPWGDCGVYERQAFLDRAAEIIEAGRDWIAECDWRDIDDADDLTTTEIVAGIARHYDGGLAQFVRDV